MHLNVSNNTLDRIAHTLWYKDNKEENYYDKDIYWTDKARNYREIVKIVIEELNHSLNYVDIQVQTRVDV